ncbi:MAG: hypothetical protein M3Y72_15815 [Acidobacteriota bacterium]|nr:hypothetical protein [Acidobacteriota bacterium]
MRGYSRFLPSEANPKPLTSPAKPKQELSHRWPWFLPDGRHFLYSVYSSRKENSGIFVGDIASGHAQQALPNQSNAAYVDAAGAGNLLFVRDGTLMSQSFDATRLKLHGEARPIAEHVSYVHDIEPLCGKFSVSDNGVLVFESVRGTDQLTWRDRDGRRLEQVGEPGVHLQPSLSPDGKQIAMDRIALSAADSIFGA